MNDEFKITKALIDLSTDSIFIIQNGIILYANPILLKISGYDLAELIGIKFTEFVNSKELENAPLKYESSAKLNNGKIIDVEVSVVHINFQGKAALQVALRDITKRKKAERKYRNIIDFAPIGFYQSTRDGHFMLANNELANILGFENNEELISRNISAFYYSTEEREKLIAKYDTPEKSDVKNIEIRFKKKDGTPIWVLMTSRAIKDNNKQTLYYDGFIIDITDRKNNELQLLERVRMEKLFNDISYQFVRESLLNTNELINTAIKKIGLFIEVDRVYVFQFEKSGTLMSNTHEWCNVGIAHQINNLQQLSVGIFPWWIDKLKKFEIIKYEDIADFPNDATTERNILEKQGIISILVLPMLSEGQLIGFVGLDSVKSQKTWIDYDVKMLETMSDLIAGQISRTKQMHELKHAKNAAEEGERRYKSLFYDNKSVMMLIDPENGDIVDANKSATNFYGYSLEQLKEMKIAQIDVLPREELEVEIRKANKEGRKQHYVKHRLASGEIKDVEAYGSKVNIFGKELIYSIFHDISKRKLAEDKVLKLTASIEQSPLSIMITDLKGIIEYVNPYYSELTGYSEIELLGKNPRIINSGIQSKEFYKKMWNTILGGTKWEGEMCNKKKNGELYWEHARISPIIDSKGKITHFVGIKEDITEKREIEKNLKFLADSLEQVGECVSITDKNDIILYVNKAFCSTYGYSKNELLGEHIGIFQPEDIQPEEIEGLLFVTKKGNWKGELTNKRKDKSLFPIMLSTSVIKDYKNNEIAFVGVAIDITEIKKSMNELIAAKEKAEESDRLKSAFLANMSHEIRTPMNGILGFSNLLLEPELSDETKEQYIQIINRNGERMLNTVNDIIEISKIEAGIVEVKNSLINVNESVKNILTFFQPQAQDKGLVLSFESGIRDTSFSLNLDRNKYESILNNLIKNAIKYTDNGTIKVSNCIKSGFIVFCIKDTGIGIPKKRKDAIFNRFEQADIENTRIFEGSGLGLTIAKLNVEILGGEIWVESVEGKGSKFYFRIPF